MGGIRPWVFVRTRDSLGAGYRRWSRVSAGLLLLTLARVECWLNFLSLLATVRGGTSFLCPTATKKRSKENASPQPVLSVPSVQTTAFGSRVERCSQNHGHLKPSFSRIPTSPRFATSGLGQDRYAHRPVWPHPCLRLTEAMWCVVISGTVVCARARGVPRFFGCAHAQTYCALRAPLAQMITRITQATNRK